MTEKVYREVNIQEVPSSWMNLNSGKRPLYDFLETIMIFALSYPTLAMVLFGLTGSTMPAYKSYLFLPVLLYMAAIRNYIKRNYIYLLMYLPLYGGAFLITGSLEEKIPVFLFLLITTFMSMKRRKDNSGYFGMSHLVMGQVLLLIEYIVSVIRGAGFIKAAIVFHSIIFVLVSIIYIHMIRTRTLMKWEKQTSKEAVERINQGSRRFVAAAASLFLAVTLGLWQAGMLLGFDEVFILSLYRRISTIFNSQPLPPPPMQTGSKPPNADMEKMFEGMGEPGKWAQLLAAVLGFLFKVLIAAILIALALLLLRALYRAAAQYFQYFRGRRAGEDEKESLLDLNDMVKEVKAKFRIFRDGFDLPFGSSNNKRIRKAYYRIVMRNKRGDTVIKGSDTPLTIEHRIKGDSNKDISPVTSIYEKARYGKGQCPGEDVERIKKFK